MISNELFVCFKCSQGQTHVDLKVILIHGQKHVQMLAFGIYYRHM